MKKQMKCSICKGPIGVHPITGWDGGNKAEPVNGGRCCDECDNTVVIPTRIAQIINTRLKPRLVVSNDEE